MAVKVVNNIPKINKMLSSNLELALTLIAALVEKEAKKLAPVDTGILRADISSETSPGKGRVRIGSTKKYSIFVEKGTGIYAEDGKGRKTPWVFFDRKGEAHWTRGQKPKPFIKPAVTNNIDEIVEIVAKQIKRIEKA